MARKVFLSVLGTGYYEKTKYYFGSISGNELETNFIQLSCINHFCKSWSSDDVAYIFLTKDAKKCNWENPTQHPRTSKPEYVGLSAVLQDLDHRVKVVPIDIADGMYESQLWEIFLTVFNGLQKGDEIYFDITHAFRSLPMLVMVLMNYSKFLKDVKVASITYGNWESKDENNYSPVIDVTAFSELQDWTNAANNLINFGNASKLYCLTQAEIHPILSATHGADYQSRLIRDIVAPLESIFENVRMCRIPEIIAPNQKLKKAKEKILEIDKNHIPQLLPIIERIKPLLFMLDENGSIFNGFQTVKWCVEYGWYQQGFTILQETMTSIVLDSVNESLLGEEKRMCVNSAFTIYRNNISKNQWNEIALKNESFVNALLSNKFIISLNEEFAELTNFRNFINHGFMKTSICDNKTIKTKLSDICFRVEQKIF